MKYTRALNSTARPFFLVLIFCIQQGISADGRQIWVGSQHQQKSIRAAIQNAQAGDTIWLDGGRYQEGSLVIDKPLSLIGCNQPVIDGERQYEILTLTGTRIRVSGITFVNSGHSAMNDFASIKCIDATDLEISNNTILESFFAIHVSNSRKIHIHHNKIAGKPLTEQNTGNGIHCWKSNHLTVEHNEISGHRDGIYLEFVTESTIRHNLSFRNIRYGLHFMFSHQDVYVENTFRDNGAGVAVMYSKQVRMERNTFEQNWGAAAYAILLKDISDSEILHNRFLQNTVGIFMEGSSRIIVEKNLFQENGWAMKVQASCDDNHFRNNNFYRNSFDVATNGTMVLNTFSHNYWDKYDGYDRGRDGIGDVAYRPVSMYSMIVEQNPTTLILLRSVLITFLDKAEKAIPSLTPENLIDENPLLTPNAL